MKIGFWWVEYKVEIYYGKRVESILPYKKPIYSETKPEGNFWGGFHCFDCAIDCTSFGATPEKAYAGNHGTDDERFCAWLGG